jgi:hypothetical protein
VVVLAFKFQGGEKMVQKKVFMLWVAGVFLCCVGGVVNAADEKLPGNAQLAQTKTTESGTNLAQTEETQSGEGAYASRTIEPELPEIKKEVEEKPIFELHGGLVGFFQFGTAGTIEGENLGDPAYPGIAADLEMTYRPPLPMFQNGRFFVRAHDGAGKGADKELGDKLFANLKTIADDSDLLDPDFDEVFWLPEVYYAHEFFDGKLTVIAGKTEPLVFIDNNAFANDPNSQFVGKPFVNNPVLDSEDQYAPIMAASFSPIESLSITALGVSSSYPNAPDERLQKSVYDSIFDQPLVAAQLAYSPKFGELQGNYRAYYWNATYDHVNSAGDTSSEGWGVGFSLDQQVTDWLGLFARLGYSDQNAYDVDWFWSAGANLKGIIPSRDKDDLGVGVAGLLGTVGPDNDGTELHTEAYYRITLSENFALTPDLQYVAYPQGNSHNDGVFVAMLRFEAAF